MELGRECLKLWGYERVDEIIWVKTNQLVRPLKDTVSGHLINTQVGRLDAGPLLIWYSVDPSSIYRQSPIFSLVTNTQLSSLNANITFHSDKK